MSEEKKRLDFGHLVDKVFWSLLIGCVLYLTGEIRQASQSIAELNEKMSAVLTRLTDYDHRADQNDHRLDRLDERIRDLETGAKHRR